MLACGSISRTDIEDIPPDDEIVCPSDSQSRALMYLVRLDVQVLGLTLPYPLPSLHTMNESSGSWVRTCAFR